QRKAAPASLPQVSVDASRTGAPNALGVPAPGKTPDDVMREQTGISENARRAMIWGMIAQILKQGAGKPPVSGYDPARGRETGGNGEGSQVMPIRVSSAEPLPNVINTRYLPAPIRGS